MTPPGEVVEVRGGELARHTARPRATRNLQQQRNGDVIRGEEACHARPRSSVLVLPKEAREGLMLAWLKVLTDRHPAVTWVPVSQPCSRTDDLAA
jgi:hypothetical protein